MEIKLSQYEVMDAVEQYINKKYNMCIDLEDQTQEYPSIEHTVYNRVWKKHKNGKDFKDKNGYVVLDKEKSSYKDKIIIFDEGADLCFYLSEAE